MNKLVASCLIAVFFSCSSGGDDSVTPEETPKDDGVPVAVNDTATTTEDTELFLSNLLDNDTVVDNARVESFDSTTANGGIVVDERTRYVYTPKAGFVGEDSFTYTLCDDDSPANCSTAIVTVTVTDEGDPIANADSFSVVENALTVLDKLLLNDDTVDDSVITAIDDSNTQGTVVLNMDKTVSYTAKAGFLGEDSFTYTICDDDLPENNCSTATVTITVVREISLSIPTEIQSYYSGTTFTDVPDIMRSNLESLTISKHTTILSYGQRHQYLYDADEDINNTSNVILMYSSESRDEREWTSGSNTHSPQTFNTEHVYPQSLLNADDAVTDLHHLRACDATVNSDRLNYPFIDGSGTYKLIGEAWFPGDEWKGDVARMMMYLNIRYGETFSKVGTIELFLKWNREDPVSAFEEQRNSVILGAQGNRNPFIDNPYLATLIWGGEAAQNRWE
ncbi:endonuclease [Seonamhaeicola sp. ML3]|uniref:endonuclease n=1 Tax=Seonamhaeicola sp. ML3 TaxID=2937786 RepID=UPI00200CB850|nr:endonuclease [Seonamhaeicola sp. ML3]